MSQPTEPSGDRYSQDLRSWPAMPHGDFPAVARRDEEPGSMPAASAASEPGQAADAPSAKATWWQRAPSWCWLILILVVQAGLSLRLLHLDTAFEDEAEYLWAGHLIWAHWMHGSAVPSFASYFSGAPVIYPPLGALADSVGGLAAARVLSLVFMLGSSALLWATTRRLFGTRSAFFGTALFAVAGPTLHLGAFATYDPLSMLLIALAAWMVVRAGERPDATGWMAGAGVALALANAAAYSTALFDPVIVALAVLVALPRPGGKAAAARAAVLVVVCAALLTGGLMLGGSPYLNGVRLTVLARASGAQSPLTVLERSWSWGGFVIVLAVCAIVVSVAQPSLRPDQPRWQRSWLLAVLAVAALLGPLEHARLHTTTSLLKHVDLGVWFAAIAAGYAVDRFVAASPSGRMRTVTLASCVLALAFPVTLGAAQGRQFATSWPNSGSFTAVFGTMIRHSSGRLLVEDPSIAQYYLPGQNWKRWSSTRNITLPDGASTAGPTKQAGVTGAGNIGVYAELITRGYFAYVALNYADTTSFDKRLTKDLLDSHRYKRAQVIPYGPSPGTYVVFVRKPGT